MRHLAYLVLRSWLSEICNALWDIPTPEDAEISGTPDWIKLRTSMTFFDYISPNEVF